MSVIYKYKLPIRDYSEVELPIKHEICDIGVQNGEAFLWVIQEMDAETGEYVKFRIFGTGHPIPEGLFFMKTLHMPPYVWHVFSPTSPTQED